MKSLFQRVYLPYSNQGEKILEVQSQGGYFYFHNEDTAYSYTNSNWVTYSYEYFPSSGSAFLHLDGESEFVEFEDGIPVSGLIIPDSNLLSSIVLPEFSGVYDPHENPFPDSVEINHSSVEAFVGRGDSGLFYSFSLEAKQKYSSRQNHHLTIISPLFYWIQ